MLREWSVRPARLSRRPLPRSRPRRKALRTHWKNCGDASALVQRAATAARAAERAAARAEAPAEALAAAAAAAGVAAAAAAEGVDAAQRKKASRCS